MAEVSRSISLACPPEKAWAVIGGFAELNKWHPAIARLETEDKDGGYHRMLETADGAQFLEKLLHHNPAKMFYEYNIINSPLPVASYKSRISVDAEGTGCRVTWSSTFDPTAQGAEEAVGGIYDAGLDNLKMMLQA